MTRTPSVPELLVQLKEVLEIVGAAVIERVDTGLEPLGLNPLLGKYGATTTTGTIGTMTGRGLAMPRLDGAAVPPLCVRAAVPIGIKHGVAEGEAEGLLEGIDDGPAEGDAEGDAEGAVLGLALGASVSPLLVGAAVPVGAKEGAAEGEAEGLLEGIDDGPAEGDAEGDAEGAVLGRGRRAARRAARRGRGGRRRGHCGRTMCGIRCRHHYVLPEVAASSWMRMAPLIHHASMEALGFQHGTTAFLTISAPSTTEILQIHDAYIHDSTHTRDFDHMEALSKSFSEGPRTLGLGGSSSRMSLVLSCLVSLECTLGGLILAHAAAGLHCTVQSITSSWAG